LIIDGKQKQVFGVCGIVTSALADIEFAVVTMLTIILKTTTRIQGTKTTTRTTIAMNGNHCNGHNQTNNDSDNDRRSNSNNTRPQAWRSLSCDM